MTRGRIAPCSLLIFTIATTSIACSDEPNDEKTAIADFVFRHQRAGQEDGNLDVYMAQWAEDAKLIFGRGPEPDRHDVEHNLDQIRATRKLYFSPPRAEKTKLRHEKATVSIETNEAELRLAAVVDEDGMRTTNGEIYKLRKRDGRWLVYEQRYWLIENAIGDDRIQFDAEHWKRQDERVEIARHNKDDLAGAFALMDACRFKEAHDAAKQLTDVSPNEPRAWLFRGTAALRSGNAEDAVSSFRKAVELDSNSKRNVPAAALR